MKARLMFVSMNTEGRLKAKAIMAPAVASPTPGSSSSDSRSREACRIPLHHHPGKAFE
jgi:hypothetical protein